jgi:HdeA/HdeB family
MKGEAMKVARISASRIGISLALVTVAAVIAAPQARAQVPLSSYTDANGYVDVQSLTCAQLAGTFQEDADYLAAWYSGWYNGLAKKHFAHVARVKSGEHQLIVYCRAHPDLKIIQAIDILLKDEK